MQRGCTAARRVGGGASRRARSAATNGPLAGAIARWIEPLESRLLLTASPAARHFEIPFCWPLPVYIPPAAATHPHRSHHPHHQHHQDESNDGTDGGDTGGEGEGGAENAGEEEEGDLLPAPAIAQEPDGTGALSSYTPLPLIGGSWTFIGPASASVGNVLWSGRIAALAAHPSDPNTIYVAAAGGGVWKTVNGGLSWNALTDAQSTLFMGAIALAPSDPNTIYAGTGEANNSIDSFYGRGILKSSDGGGSWTLLGNSIFDRRSISRIVVDPTDKNVVYATVGGFPPNGFAGNRGVWKSTDGGIKWSNTTASITTAENFSDLAIDPTNPQVLYCAIGRYNGTAVNGVYKTTNGGVSWSAAGDFGNGSANGRITLAIAPSNPQTLYAAVTSPASFGLARMMKTIDGGATWKQLINTPNNQGSQGWYDTTLAVDPIDANTVYSGGAASGIQHVMKSADGGVTWTGIAVGGAIPHVDHHAIGFDAAGKLLDGSDGGIWRLTNPILGSIAWTNLNSNLGTLEFQGIALHPTDPGIAFGGTQDNGTLQYQNSLSWSLRDGGDGGDVAVSKVDPNIVYHDAPIASFGSSSFFRRSDNGGLTFSDKTVGINGSDPANFYPPFVMDPSNSSRLLLGTNRVYETINNAETWTPISTPGSGGWDVSGVIDAIAPAPTDPNTIYATSNGATYVTTNRGASWTRRDIPGGSDDILDLLVDPSTSLTVYAVRDRFGGAKVFRSINGGVTWASITGNLPDSPANTIALDPNSAGSSDDILFVGTDIGVYESNNLGQSWSRVGGNFPDAMVVDLEFNPSQDLLAAGTHGRGAWLTSSALVVGGSGSISGNVFQDTNGNATLDSGEPALVNAVNSKPSSVTVFLDLNNSGSFDGADAAATTDGNGNYSFNGLADGTYSIGEVVASGYIRTGSLFLSATVNGGGAVTGKNLGNFPIVFDAGTNPTAINGNGSDQYLVRIDPANATRLQIIQTLLGQSAVTFSITQSLIATLTIDSGAGDDQITVDYSNGNPIPSVGLNIDAGTQSTTNADRITITGSGGADNFVINSLDLVPAATGGSIAIRGAERTTITGGAGNDALTLGGGLSGDVTFDAGANTDLLVYNGTEVADALTLGAGAITTNTTTTLYQNIESLVVNSLGGDDTITLNSTGPTIPPTTINGGNGNDLFITNTAPQNTMVFNGGLLASDHDTLDVRLGSFTLGADAVAGTANLTVDVDVKGTAIFNSSQHLEALSIAGGLATLSPNGNRVIVTSNLSISGGGKLDLADNDLILSYSGASPIGSWNGSTYTGVIGMLASGYKGGASGAWTGPGIRTSSAGTLTRLGVSEASAALEIAGAQTALFDGQTVDATTVLVKYTYTGDATLDGKVDVDDFGRIDFSVSIAGRGWSNGDFNYDGKINVDDYGSLDFTRPIQGPPL